MRRFIGSRLTIIERHPGYSSANALSPFKCRGNTSSTDLISMATRASPITASTSIPVYVRQYDRRSSLSLYDNQARSDCQLGIIGQTYLIIFIEYSQ